VTGKGGVGKTSTAAALALLAARGGRRVLVCEMDAKGSLASAFDAAPLVFQPREIERGLFAMAMNTEDSLREYLRLFVKVPLLGKIGPLARTFDFVADAAPGVKEILTVGKFCWEVREDHYDLVVVDASATGHIVGQLTAPQSINQLVQVGMVRNQTDWLLEILNNPSQTGVVIVSAPEEMPVNETIELAERLAAETDVDLAAVVVNRVLPELFGRAEEEIFDGLAQPARVKELSELVGGDVAPVMEAAQLAVTLRRTRASYIADLRQHLPSDLPMLYIPYLFSRSYGLRSINMVAEHLAEELGL
jgi:anion-transporting  ArsA/GET3 family ATPase